MDVAYHETVQRPALAPGPGGTLPVALAAVAFHHFPGLRVEFHDVAYGAVRADEMFSDGVRVQAGNLTEPGVFRLLAGPVQEGEVEHAVDDGPASGILLQVVPRADEISHGVEPSRQKGGGVQGHSSGIRVPCEPEIRHRRRHEHKAHVVVQAVEIRKALLHLPFRDPGNVGIAPLSRVLV